MYKTIYDVAREAGVVDLHRSRAQNNSGYVSEKARAKVEAAMRGY
jgi:DNA-binding LacI/PurR family transcriptional regulator